MKKSYSGRPAFQRLVPAAGSGTGLRRAGALLLTAMGLSLGAKAQQAAAPQFFRADGEARGAAAASPLAAALFQSQALTLDVPGLRAALATAPAETQAGAVPLVLALPLPNGRTGRFALHEAPVMAPALAARFPSIKTYAGTGLDDASASVRLDLSPRGFHAQVLAADGQSFYIDPVSPTDARHYLGFYRKDMDRAAAGPAAPCGFEPTAADQKASAARLAAWQTASPLARASGAQLHTYRLALACTPEYALTKGNTVASVLAGEVATVNRVVGVYEKELAVRLVLVPNNDQLVFLSGIGTQASPAYSNTNGGAMLGQNQSNVDRIIGTANYDIGHVVSTGGGGVAYLGVVCSPTRKAGGVTGSSRPVGDAFDIDYVAHEMGHQFAGNHPFNGNAGSCAGGNRNPRTAWEPGSGTTIMAYAGICTATNDLQPNSDPVFHTGNYQEMRAFIAGTTCAVVTATGNTAPVVTAPASGKTLPIGTPFRLTATATDAESDPLTYMWEELDLGPTGTPTTAQVANETPPLFRSFVPSPDGTRYFPRLSELVANTTRIGERLPTVTRTLKFRCTARDSHSGPAGVVGGVDYSALVNLDVTSTAGPFVVTAPNAAAVSWTGGTAQTITWDVANTTAAPVSCALVNLRLSLDGGLSYPVTLAANVANSGTAAVTVPNVATTTARVLVEAADNYFFDISNVNFTITPGTGPTITGFTPASGPVGTAVTIAGTNFTGATAVSINGTPATFAVGSATSLTATVAAGTSSGPISVTTPDGTAVSATAFLVGSPPTVISFTPTTGAVGSTVVITGTNFVGATQVTFAGTNAPVFSVNSATQITVMVPNGAVTGPISVYSPLGTGTSATSFILPAVPQIASFTPTTGIPGTVVTITGTNFTGATVVTFNGTPATAFTVVSATQITVTVPTGATTGLLTVVTPIGVAVSTGRFTVQVPTITSFTPTSGPVGTSVTINGNYFTNATQVTFNGTVAPGFVVVSATQITVTVPVGATAGPITVVSPVGSGTSATPFLIPPPNDLCANAIALACGQTLTGSNLGVTATGDPTAACSTAIRAGGLFYSVRGTGASLTLSTCTPTTDFDTELFVYSGSCGNYTCIDGNDDLNSTVTCSSVTFASQYGVTYLVFVNGYDNTEVGNFGLTLSCATPPAAPVITSLSPTTGPAGSTVTVTGSNFASATAATLNGVAVGGFTVVNATTITFVVPAGATSGNVVITTATGVPSNGTVFTVTTATATAQAQQSEFSVYPNPVAAKGTLRVTLAAPAASASLTLRNVLGQLVSTRTFSGTTTELSTSGLATGTYLLMVQTDRRAPSIQRVVVE